MTFEEMIDRLLDNNISIELKKIGGVVWYDLNTGMKSHLYITKSPNTDGDEIAICQGRYDYHGSIDTWGGLIRQVKSCMQGRDYMNGAWFALLMKEGYLKVSTKTVYE